jgi:hypothetical protein
MKVTKHKRNNEMSIRLTNVETKMKTSKQIEKDLEKYSDYADAYGDAIDALKEFEKKSITFRRGKVVKRPIAHNEINSLSCFSGYAKK